jgi:hypothetical protein
MTCVDVVLPESICFSGRLGQDPPGCIRDGNIERSRDLLTPSAALFEFLTNGLNGISGGKQSLDPSRICLQEPQQQMLRRDGFASQPGGFVAGEEKNASCILRHPVEYREHRASLRTAAVSDRRTRSPLRDRLTEADPDSRLHPSSSRSWQRAGSRDFLRGAFPEPSKSCCRG